MPKAVHNPLPAFVLMLQVIILDQLTKLWVRISIPLGDSVPVLPSLWGDLLQLTHANNKGAAFSLSVGSASFNRIFFVSTALLAVAFIIYLLYQNTHKIQVFAFGLIMGGALGNAIDRVLIGGVTDYVDVDFPNFIMQRFPIFNVADSCIFIAVMLLIYEMFFIKDKTAVPTGEEAVQIEVNNKEI